MSADDAVGERAGDETIEKRIDHAAEKADFPGNFASSWAEDGDALGTLQIMLVKQVPTLFSLALRSTSSHRVMQG